MDKPKYTDLNKAFEHRIRLSIMSLLMIEEFMDFKTLKSTLELTDGNLASHLKSLEKLGFIDIKKSFVGKKPNTKYYASKSGKEAFIKHLNALEMIMKQTQIKKE